MSYETQAGDFSLLELRFSHAVRFEVLQGRDLRSVVVRVKPEARARAASGPEPGEAGPALAPADARTLSLRVHHTFLKLPDPGYEPRALDPRIGFIPQRHREHTAAFTEPIDRYFASRWRLAKKDPAARVSEPVQPILFYLDRGMPEPERTGPGGPAVGQRCATS